MGLLSRMVVIIVLGLSASLSVSLVVLARHEKSEEAQAAVDETLAFLSTLSVPAALYVTQGQVPDLDNLFAEAARRQSSLGLTRLLLVDNHGLVLADTGDASYGAPFPADAFVDSARYSSSPTVETLRRLPIRVSLPVQTGIRWGTLVASLSISRLEDRVADRRNRLLMTSGAVSMAGLLLLLTLLWRWVIVPVRNAAYAAEQMAEGDLTARCPGEERGDELGVLAHALNLAASRLADQRGELERLVKKRTQELEASNARLSQANGRLERLAVTDGLTGLLNHRALREQLDGEIRRQKRALRAFSLIMLDVDHFKHYNDTFGHLAGDEVLRELGRLLRETVRTTDIVGRYGGEEFVVVLVDTGLSNAVTTAEKVRERIAAHSFAHAAEQPLGCVSVSIGVATWPDDGVDSETLIDAADQALYASKEDGRNRVTAAKPRGLLT